MKRTFNFVIAINHPRYSGLQIAIKKRFGSRCYVIHNRDDLNLEKLSEINPVYIFFPHWSYIIPKSIHETFECVIFHMTDVPFGRGGSPLQNLVSRGIYDTKLTALRCVSQLDAGPVYLKHDLSLAGSAHEILQRAAHIMEDMIARIVSERPSPIPQKGEPTLFPRRKPEEGNLAPIASTRQIYDYIRMLDADGYPSAFLSIGGIRYEFTEARFENGEVTARVIISEQDDPND